MEAGDPIFDSIAFSVLDDLWKAKELTKVEVEFLRKEYYNVYSTLQGTRTREIELGKKCNQLHEDIMSQKLLCEKSKIDESDEMRQFKKLEDAKMSILRELEYSEQQEMISKFELSELQRVHDELSVELSLLHTKNENLVSPILENLRNEISSLEGNLTGTDDALTKESKRKDELSNKINELEKIHADKAEVLASKEESLKSADSEPQRISRQVESIEKAIQSLSMEYSLLLRKKESLEKELSNQKHNFTEAEKLRKTLNEKLDVNRKTLQSREQDVLSVSNNLDVSRSKVHDFLLKKVELNGARKELETDLRRKIDQFNFAKKEYENMKRQLKKKRMIVDSIKELIPKLEDQKKDIFIDIQLQKHESEKLCKISAKLKQETDACLAHLLHKETLSIEKKSALDAMILESDKAESLIEFWVGEGKRLRKLLSLLNAQKDVKSREVARLTHKDRDAKQHVKIKELTILDLTKRCNEISNRLKEFSALYEVVKNERNKYVNMIQASNQALAEMKEKIRILTNEVEILGNESSAKDVALSKEKGTHLQAQRQRDSLRQDMNRLLADYRTKQSDVERQIQEIDKMNVVIQSLESEMWHIRTNYEKSVDERNMTGVQLIDRNDELCLLYEKVNQQQDTYKVGEEAVLRKEEELRVLRLQLADLERQYTLAKDTLPGLEYQNRRIEELEQQLTTEKRKNDDLSSLLEDPHNLNRWRPLDGDDCESEQLASKILSLEDRLDKKREKLLEKQMLFEEINSMSEKLKYQALNQRDSSKRLSDQLNSIQNKIREVTKKMLATVSELSMYQATALKLQQERTQRERKLEECRWRYSNGEAPTDEVIKELELMNRNKNSEKSRRELAEQLEWRRSSAVKTTADPRPTAYIPDDIGIPKPYGSQPFKPTLNGTSMRHIKHPIPRLINI